MYVCGVPKDVASLHRILELDRLTFGDDALLSKDNACAIFAKRPEVYCGVFRNDSSVAAYMDIYPLRRSAATQLIDGRISEADLSPDMMLGREEDHHDCCIYLGSLAADGSIDPATRKVLIGALLSWRLRQFARLGLPRIQVVMIPVSPEGEDLSRRFGADKISSARNRKDHHDLYSLTLTPKSAELLISKLYPHQRHDELVQMDFDFEPSLDEVVHGAS